MSYKVVPTQNFERELKKLARKYPSLKSDLLPLIASLTDTPIQGSEIYKNCYKIRLAIKSKGKGKSGGSRVVTFVKIQDERVYLISIFDKSERSTITDKEIKELLENL